MALHLEIVIELCVTERATDAAVVQLLSRVWLSEASWTEAYQAPLSSAISQSLLKFMFIDSVMLSSNHLILCHPLLLLPSILHSIRVFSNEPALRIRWPEYWTFSFSISPFSEYSGLISFKIAWFDLLAVQGALKSVLQHYSWKTSFLWCSAFFIVQLLHSYMTIGKTIPLIICIFVGKVMPLLYNMLYRFFIAFVPRSKRLWISWLRSLSAVILEPDKVKSVTTSTCPPSICHEVMGLGAMISWAWHGS